jgi:aminoglycoside phosphotransferase (APT) family kinase protein
MSPGPEDLLDRTRAVRDGEQLDAARLEAYLRAQTGISLGLVKGPIEIEQFPSGHSNLTYLVRAPAGDGIRELVLRRPPFGSKVKTAHDMGREHRILSQLHAVFPAPRPLLYCEDAEVIGAPFYLMERVRGLVLRRTPPPGLDFSPDLARHLSLAFADCLAALHAVDYRAIGLGDLGKPEGYVARQVGGWTRRWKDAQTDDVPDVDAVATWLAARIPVESAAALIHNDFKYDNLVLDAAGPTRILAVLDWEMATLGDPLMDLGTALSYWVEAGDSDELKLIAFGPTAAPGSLTRLQLAERYAERAGRALPDLTFYYCFALFKTAVVAQQIYRRFQQGLTHDPRFAGMIVAVRVLSAAAAKAAARGRIGE